MCESARHLGDPATTNFLMRGLSTVAYKRVGKQPAVAAPAIRTVSKAKNGIVLATYDHMGPASSVSIYLNSGSRCDSANQPGASHLLHRSLIRVD